MKELKFPWAHWHSQSNSIPREIFDSDSEFHTESLFAEVTGAEHLEAIVKTGIRRWTKSRIATELADSAVSDKIGEYVRQIVTPTSANLVSSSMEFKRAIGQEIPLPSTFFFDLDGLELAILAIDPLSDAVPGRRMTVDGTLYNAVAQQHDLHVKGEGNETKIQGDTHFCFLVPEKAFEDLEVARQMLERGIVSARFLLCLLMVDFPNPVHSPRRASLLRHCPETIDPGQPSALDEPMANSIRLAATSVGSPEMEFLSYWDDVQLLTTVKHELANYVDGIENLVRTEAGVAKLLKYAEFRKSQFRNRLLNEFISTTSQITGSVNELRMSKAGNIV